MKHETRCVGKGLLQSLHDIQRLPNDGSRIALVERIIIVVGCESMVGTWGGWDDRATAGPNKKPRAFAKGNQSCVKRQEETAICILQELHARIG